MDDLHEVTFEGVERTREKRLSVALGTAFGIAKLIERARHGDAEEADANASCALAWAELLVSQLKATPPAGKNITLA